MQVFGLLMSTLSIGAVENRIEPAFSFSPPTRINADAGPAVRGALATCARLIQSHFGLPVTSDDRSTRVASSGDVSTYLVI
jgi:hypothetical protein